MPNKFVNLPSISFFISYFSDEKEMWLCINVIEFVNLCTYICKYQKEKGILYVFKHTNYLYLTLLNCILDTMEEDK